MKLPPPQVFKAVRQPLIVRVVAEINAQGGCGVACAHIAKLPADVVAEVVALCACARCARPAAKG